MYAGAPRIVGSNPIPSAIIIFIGRRPVNIIIIDVSFETTIIIKLGFGTEQSEVNVTRTQDKHPYNSLK